MHYEFILVTTYLPKKLQDVYLFLAKIRINPTNHIRLFVAKLNL